MKLRLLIYLTLVFLSLTSADCLKKEDSPTSPTHETKITVNLTGEYAESETAEVSIDGGGITVVDVANPAYSVVEPGTHTIFATARVLNGTWSHTTEVKEGESKTIYIPCDRATLIVKPDILWAGTVDEFEVVVKGDFGQYEFNVLPGDEGSTSFRPEIGMEVAVYRANNGGGHQVADLFFHNFFYQDKFTLTIPYK